MGQEDRYRLAPVRDARERNERIRRGDLAAAVGDARETQARLDAARARTVAARTALSAALATSELRTAAHRAAADRFVTRRRHELEAAIGEELRAEAAHASHLGQVDEARLRLARARADRQVIERHFERWRETKRKLADRRED